MSIQTGGELIGHGSFGCVFNPSIKCPTENKSDKKIVSKVFINKEGKKELNEEYNISLNIKKIRGVKIGANYGLKNVNLLNMINFLKMIPI